MTKSVTNDSFVKDSTHGAIVIFSHKNSRTIFVESGNKDHVKKYHINHSGGLGSTVASYVAEDISSESAREEISRLNKNHVIFEEFLNIQEVETFLGAWDRATTTNVSNRANPTLRPGPNLFTASELDEPITTALEAIQKTATRQKTKKLGEAIVSAAKIISDIKSALETVNLDNEDPAYKAAEALQEKLKSYENITDEKLYIKKCKAAIYEHKSAIMTAPKFWDQIKSRINNFLLEYCNVKRGLFDPNKIEKSAIIKQNPTFSAAFFSISPKRKPKTTKVEIVSEETEDKQPKR